jgi:hypothetical protein
MAAQTYVGSFAKRAGTGTQVVSGVGFTPKAVFFWTGGATTADSGFENVDLQQCTGISDGVHSFCTAHRSGDGLTSSSTAHGYYATAAIVTVDLGGTLNALANMVGFTSDGFTLDWTSSVSADGILIHFIAIGGAAVQARVGNIVSVNSTGNQAITGVGFEPQSVLFLMDASATTTLPNVSTGYGPNGIGWATASAQGTVDDDSVAPLNPSDTTRYQRTDKCVSSYGSGITWEGAMSSLDADGFTINWTVARVANLGYLALSGLVASVGALTTPAATGTQHTALGFQPQAVLFLSTGQAASTSIQTQNRMSVGATDGTRQRVSWSGDNNNVSPTQTARYDATTSVIVAATPAAAGGSSTKNAEASLSAFEDDGFTLNWTTVDVTTRQVLYFAIGADTTSNRNLLTGSSHTVQGSDNLIAGGSNTVTGQYSEAHGLSTTVNGRLAVAYGLDGASHTLTDDGIFQVYGDFTATGVVTVPFPTNSTDAATKAYVDGVASGASFVKIAEQTPTGTGTVTFSSLGSYTHLKILYSGRSTNASTSVSFDMRFNADTGANYDRQKMSAAATTQTDTESLGQTLINEAGVVSGSTAPSGACGAGEITIYNYRGTAFWKRITMVFGIQSATSSGGLSSRVNVGTWRSTAAITSVSMILQSGNWDTGSTVSLYGIA